MASARTETAFVGREESWALKPAEKPTGRVSLDKSFSLSGFSFQRNKQDQDPTPRSPLAPPPPPPVEARSLYQTPGNGALGEKQNTDDLTVSRVGLGAVELVNQAHRGPGPSQPQGGTRGLCRKEDVPGARS